MPTIAHVFLLLGCAHVLGGLSGLVKQPPLLGHLLAGLLLGPSALVWIEPTVALRFVSDVAVVFVVVHSGLKMRLIDAMDLIRGRGAIAMATGFLVPAAAGAAVAAVFSLPPESIAAVALCVAVTALPVALQILSSFGLLETQVARVSIFCALCIDIAIFTILGVLLELGLELDANDSVAALDLAIGLAAAKVFGFVACVAAADWICLQPMRRRILDQPASSMGVAFAVIFIAAIALTSQILGFHFAIGAFVGATLIGADVVGERYFQRLQSVGAALAGAVFGPLFIAYQGLQLHVQDLNESGFLLVLVAVAVVAKLSSGYLAGRLLKMSRYEALGIGIVMNARGVMGLVVANIALRAELIDAKIFSALVLMDLATTVLTPILLKYWQAAPLRTNESRTV